MEPFAPAGKRNRTDYIGERAETGALLTKPSGPELPHVSILPVHAGYGRCISVMMKVIFLVPMASCQFRVLVGCGSVKS